MVPFEIPEVRGLLVRDEADLVLDALMVREKDLAFEDVPVEVMLEFGTV